jgi:hypothetical protein
MHVNKGVMWCRKKMVGNLQLQFTRSLFTVNFMNFEELNVEINEGQWRDRKFTLTNRYFWQIEQGAIVNRMNGC